MRIAHFIHRYPPALGGSEAYFARLSRHLVAAGHQVRVHTTNADELESFWKRNAKQLPSGGAVEDGVEVQRHRLSRWPGQRYLLKLLSLIPYRRLQCLCMAHNPVALTMWASAVTPPEPVDLVHATAFPYGWPLVCGLRMAQHCKAPFVLTPFLHVGDPDDPRDRTRRQYTQPALLYLARKASRIFVQTEIERAALIERGIAEDKLILQGMGVDVADCTGGSRARFRARHGIGEGEIVIGHLANKSREKGTVDLLDAASLAWRSGASFRVVVAGAEMSNFRRHWETYADRERVIRLGPLSESEKRDFYAGLDVFALPSRSDSFGIVLLEAWANGVPTVGYRAGGIASVIRHEEDGLLVPCGNLESLGCALTRLAENASMRETFGKAGRERTLRDFQWEDKLSLVERECRKLTEGQALRSELR